MPCTCWRPATGKANKPITLVRIIKWLLLLDLLSAAGMAAFQIWELTRAGETVTAALAPALGSFFWTLSLGAAAVMAIAAVILVGAIVYFTLTPLDSRKNKSGS